MNPDWLVSSGGSSGATPVSRLISARSNHRVGQLKAEVKLCFVLAVSSKYSDNTMQTSRAYLRRLQLVMLTFPQFPPTNSGGGAGRQRKHAKKKTDNTHFINNPSLKYSSHGHIHFS